MKCLLFGGNLNRGERMSDKAILFDSTKCIACRGCQVACKQWNELSAEETVNSGSYENPPDLSPTTWLTIKFFEKSEGNSIDWLFGRRSCMHCTDAACVEVCPSGALSHSEYGFVIYDKDKCIGCGYCSQHCPFDIPRLDTNIVTGVGKMDKCSLCTTPGLDRVSAGELPACVKTCPTGALIFGDREELLARGHSLVDSLKVGNSKAYPNATLYGEHELGGLHVLYVLTDSPEFYGLPEDPKFPVVATIYKDILGPVARIAWPLVAAGLALNVLVAWFRQKKHEEVH
jgi:formate dehydrogenase iron-sulfur subunit